MKHTSLLETQHRLRAAEVFTDPFSAGLDIPAGESRGRHAAPELTETDTVELRAVSAGKPLVELASSGLPVDIAIGDVTGLHTTIAEGLPTVRRILRHRRRCALAALLMSAPCYWRTA